MTDDISEIRRDIGSIRESVAEIRGAQRVQGEEIARVSGRIETIFGVLTAGQGAQDDRIAKLAIEQGEARGEASARRLWQSWLIPAAISSAIAWLARLWPLGHHP